MDPKFNPETAKIYHFRYMREYRAVAVLWGLLSIIWCILNLVAFIQPQWIGDTPDPGSGYGHMGVFQYCYPDTAKEKYVCSGSFTDFDTILNDSFRACTFFVGVSALLMLIVVAALLLFFCFKKTAVFVFSGILQLISVYSSQCPWSSCKDQNKVVTSGRVMIMIILGLIFVNEQQAAGAVFMLLACIIYPSGWNHAEVTLLCGEGAGEYKLGECGIRWAYILAILGIFDAAVLAVLAFFLAAKRAKIEIYSASGTVTKCEYS
nr:hypothetical protein BaRGS_026131 [Batillaria attramentaria]